MFFLTASLKIKSQKDYARISSLHNFTTTKKYYNDDPRKLFGSASQVFGITDYQVLVLAAVQETMPSLSPRRGRKSMIALERSKSMSAIESDSCEKEGTLKNLER